MDRFTGMSVFTVAAEEGSLIAAASRHGLSPSMAGKHIAANEAEMNVGRHSVIPLTRRDQSSCSIVSGSDGPATMCETKE
jgi:hypothetical protein